LIDSFFDVFAAVSAPFANNEVESLFRLWSLLWYLQMASSGRVGHIGKLRHWIGQWIHVGGSYTRVSLCVSLAGVFVASFFSCRFVLPASAVVASLSWNLRPVRARCL